MDETNQILVNLQKDIAVRLLPVFLVMSLILTIILLTRNEQAKQQLHVSFSGWLLGVGTVFLVGFGIFFGTFYFSGYLLTNISNKQAHAYFVPFIFLIQGIVQKIIIRFLFKRYETLSPTVIQPKDQPKAAPTIDPKKFAVWLAPVVFAIVGLLFKFPALADPNGKLIYVIIPIIMGIPLFLIVYISTKHKK